MSEYQKLEKHIRSLFKPGTKFEFNNKKYKVLICQKPSVPRIGGECKTDCYILAEDVLNKSPLELKLSIKRKDVENYFIENKMKLRRAKQIFGGDIRQIKESINKLKNLFIEKTPKIITKDNFNKLKDITLGWRADIYNQDTRKLHDDITISNNQITEIFKGSKFEDEKIHAKIKNRKVKNSGIPEYIIISERPYLKYPEDVIKQMKLIDKYVKNIKEVALAFNRVTLRPNEKNGRSNIFEKWEHARSLAVFIDWKFKNNELIPTMVYDKPLEINSNEIANQLILNLKRLVGKKITIQKNINEYLGNES